MPEIIRKVAEAKRLLETGEKTTVNGAAREVGISRSAFYKYKDAVHPFQDMLHGFPHRHTLVNTHKWNPIGDLIIHGHDRCLQAFQKFCILRPFINGGKNDSVHPIGRKPRELILLKILRLLSCRVMLIL